MSTNVLDTSIPTVDIGSVRDIRCLLRAIIYRLNKAFKYPLYMGVSSDNNYGTTMTPSMIGYTIPFTYQTGLNASGFNATGNSATIGSSGVFPIGKYFVTVHGTIQLDIGSGTLTGTPAFPSLKIEAFWCRSNASNPISAGSITEGILTAFTPAPAAGAFTGYTVRSGFSMTLGFARAQTAIAAANDYLQISCSTVSGAATGVTSSVRFNFHGNVQRIG